MRRIDSLASHKFTVS